jgi:hypothetical protein
MPHFYVDDSVQDRGDFVLGAVVFGPDAEVAVSEAIEKAGLRPGVDEFKSSVRMSQHPEQVKLREDPRYLLHGYRIGVLVVPRSERSNLGHYALQAVDQFSNANGLRSEPDLQLFLDEGMFASNASMSQSVVAIGIDRYCSVHPEQDSREIKGLQLADLAAHTAGLMLPDSLGLLKKVVRAGDKSGYEPDTEIELGFEMWASLRYQFFSAGPVPDQDPVYNGALTKVGSNGLFIAPSCDDRLRAAAIDRFDDCYWGCIH